MEFTNSYQNIYIRKLGASPIDLGVVNSATPIMNTIISLPIGWLQDRYSLRKLYLIGIGLFTLVPLFYATAYSWEIIIPAMILAAFCQKEGSCMIICNISLENRDRLTAKSLCEGIGRIPTLLAPLTAAMIIYSFGGLTIDGIRPLYWIRFVVAVILFIFLITHLKEIVRPQLNWSEEEKKKFSSFEALRSLFKKGSTLKIWIIYSAISSFFRIMLTSFRYPFANEIKGADQFMVGAIATAAILCQIIMYTPLGRLSDRIGRKKTLYLLMPLTWASYLLFVVAPRPEILIIAGFLTGFESVSMIVENAMSAELVPIEYMGRWIGIMGLFVGLIDIPAPIIGGFIWQSIGPIYLFLIPILIDLTLKLPILSKMPETLHKK